MRLENHAGLVIESPTSDDVLMMVMGLTETGEAYVILSDYAAEETYVQAAGTVAEDFIIERRDGCAGEHYRGDRRISADDLVGLFVRYCAAIPSGVTRSRGTACSWALSTTTTSRGPDRRA